MYSVYVVFSGIVKLTNSVPFEINAVNVADLLIVVVLEEVVVELLEAAVPILDPAIKKELQDIIHIQLQDNVKARVLDSALLNNYVPLGTRKKIRSQVETYLYLQQKTNSKK